MDPAERLERLDRILEDLTEASLAMPIIVEGLRDEAALRVLGVDGEILVYNRGEPMTAIADRLRTRGHLIVLFDWDRKGGHLTRLLREQLGGLVRLDLETRKALAQVSLVRCVEDLPAARRTLRKRVEKRFDAD